MDDLPPAEPPAPGTDPLADEAAEIRRLIDAGAGSPEELRALAERLRAHREREDQRWRDEVKPTLKRIRRGEAPPPLPVELATPPLEAPAGPDRAQRIALGAGLAAVVLLVVLLAASSSVLWIVVPVIALLAYAWWHGRRVA